MDLTPTVEYLAARFQLGSGWHEFRTLAGLAVDWPTAYVAASLADAGASEVVARAVETLLVGQQDTDGWGYHRKVPDDCDSTAYALIFLAGQARGQAIIKEAVASGAARLKAQQRSDGGFATYGDGRAIREFMEISEQVPLDGWTQTHPEVTAAAGLALLAAGEHEEATRAWACLTKLQDEVGGWRSYWWTNDFYATALATRLAAALGVGDRETVRAANWCKALQSPCGAWRDSRNGAHSVMATALSLQVCGQGGSCGAFSAGVGWLEQTRRADGGWDGEFALRIPPPHIINPAAFTGWQPGGLGGGAVICDEGGCYVTATVMSALTV